MPRANAAVAVSGPFGSLSRALTIRIFAMLNTRDRLRVVGSVCKGWRSLRGDQFLWRSLDATAPSASNEPSNAATQLGMSALRKLLLPLKKGEQRNPYHVVTPVVAASVEAIAIDGGKKEKGDYSKRCADARLRSVFDPPSTAPSVIPTASGRCWRRRRSASPCCTACS